jgi:hypothetical protein
MSDFEKNEYVHYPPFRPSLRGCVGRDTRLAAAVYTCSCEAFWSISDNIWRSLVYKDRDTSLSDLFDELAQADLEHFRALGELFWALNEGENFPKPYCFYRKRAARSPHHQASLADAALWERRRNMDCFDALMKRTEDRVVLSVFSKILSCESSLCRRLEPFCKG